MTDTARPAPLELPRELAPGLFWLGQCLEQPFTDDVILHAYNSVYLVTGSERSLLVETGFPSDWEALDRQLDGLLAGAPPLTHIFTSHAEIPHASGLGRLMAKHPQTVLCGDTRDYHVIFPEIADRLLPCRAGDEIDLGGTRFVFVEALIKDLEATLWGFDTRRRALFPGDGFAYMHQHGEGQCGHLAEEVPQMPLAELAGIFAEFALYWTRFTEMEPYIERLDALLDDEDLGIELILPTHGLPITDLERTIPLIREGLRTGAARGV